MDDWDGESDGNTGIGDTGDVEVTAVGMESELVGAGLVEGAVVATAAADTTACDSSTSGAGSGAAATGLDGARSARAEACATEEMTALLVPIAEDAASVGDACSASCVEDAGGGGGSEDSAALVSTCWASEVVVVEVNSVGVTTAGSAVEVEVAAVRARERVHRLPLTVVVKSCGVAMQKTHS